MIFSRRSAKNPSPDESGSKSGAATPGPAPAAPPFPPMAAPPDVPFDDSLAPPMPPPIPSQMPPPLAPSPWGNGSLDLSGAPLEPPTGEPRIGRPSDVNPGATPREMPRDLPNIFPSWSQKTAHPAEAPQGAAPATGPTGQAGQTGPMAPAGGHPVPPPRLPQPTGLPIPLPPTHPGAQPGGAPQPLFGGPPPAPSSPPAPAGPLGQYPPRPGPRPPSPPQPSPFDPPAGSPGQPSSGQMPPSPGRLPFGPGGPTATTEAQPRAINIATLLRAAVEKGASDLHLSTGISPTIRIDGFLEPLDFPMLTAADSRRLVYSILNDEQKSKFETNWELDFSIDMERVGRFRVNIHKQRGAVEGAFRVVNDVIQPIRRLGLPPAIEDLARRDSGLVLVTGPTGSGKTTTLAAMVDLINTERQCMIITIEDPIEYIHQNKRSIIKQREVAADTKSFTAALRHVLRQDPDVIVVGEMRDLETIQTAITAAETGHLVLATLHTPDVVQTIDRVVDVFPSHQQQQVRIQLANALEGIISQQLLPIPGGRGRVVAVEIMIATTAIRKIIRTSKTEQIISAMQTSWEVGMITMDKSLKNLYAQGLVTYDDAVSKCRYPENFEAI